MILALLGAGSEYALEPVAAEARRRGHPVVELNMYDPAWRIRAKELPPGQFVLLTSHHPFVDGWLHRQSFGFAADVVALPEFVARHNPARSYFLPHDLTSPLATDEFAALHLFDGLLMPDERYWFLRDRLPITVVGWIKAVTTTILPSHSVAVLPSEIAYFLREDPQRFRAVFARLLAARPRIKFPRFPDVERLEDTARELGAEVIDAGISSEVVIRSSQCVVTNGLSSITLESVRAGRPTLCLLDGIHPPETQRRLFGGIANVDLLPPDTAADWITRQAGSAAEAIQPDSTTGTFNFDLLFEVIGL